MSMASRVWDGPEIRKFRENINTIGNQTNFQTVDAKTRWKETYLPTVMWKFPATLLTWRYPCIRQAFRGWVGSSSLQIEWKTYTPLEMTALYLSVWRNTFPYRCHVFWPWWESSGGTFHDILKQNILEWMFLTQMVLNEQKCPEGHKTQIYIYIREIYIKLHSNCVPMSQEALWRLKTYLL